MSESPTLEEIAKKRARTAAHWMECFDDTAEEWDDEVRRNATEILRAKFTAAMREHAETARIPTDAPTQPMGIATEYAAIIERRLNIVLREHSLPAMQVKALDELIQQAINDSYGEMNARWRACIRILRWFETFLGLENKPSIDSARLMDAARALVAERDRLGEALDGLYGAELNAMAMRGLPLEWQSNCKMERARLALGYPMPEVATLSQTPNPKPEGE